MKKTKMSYVLSCLSLFILPILIHPNIANALVDYSEVTNENNPTNKMTSKIPSPKTEGRALIWKSDFSLSTAYETSQIDSEKIGALNINGHLQTPFNVFFDIAYWNASAKSLSSSGNTKAIIGFNWLRFGSPADEAKFDIYGGAKLAAKSPLASSRNDKIFGLETTKRFGFFGLGLGYELSMTGTPQNNQDMSLGNIQKISVSSGWIVSNDIQFEFEFENFNIQASTDSSHLNKLDKAISFSTFSPKLNLMLAPAVNLELGARFKTNKIKSSQNLSSAKLFDLHGAYSNSMFAGLSFNI